MNSSSGFSQQQKQSQSQVFAPQLRQSLKILQVPAIELRDAILEELEANPILEELPVDSVSVEQESTASDEAPDQDASEELEFKDDFEVLNKLDEEWHDYLEGQQSPGFTKQDADRRQHFFDSVVSEVSLQEHLMDQLKLSECSEAEFKAVEYLIGSLDDKGFLTSSFKEIASLSKIPEKTIEKAQHLLKNLDPLGIGSRTIQECLLVQLEFQDHGDSLAAKIIKDHYPLLLRRRIPELAKQLSVSVEDVQEAVEEIATLDPAPGRRFNEDTNSTVTADIVIVKEGSDWNVTLNDEYIPRLRLSRAYKDLIAKGSLTRKEKEYIKDKMRSGRFVINAIEQRQKTLERLANKLLELQKDFFEHGVSKLKPLTMSQVGEALGLHETTISRAISSKYILTPHGLFPLRYFFTFGFESAEGKEISNTTIKEDIAKIIQSEPPQKPYSDQKIADILSEKGMKIARRTVAKYREELGILATSLRRKY